MAKNMSLIRWIRRIREKAGDMDDSGSSVEWHKCSRIIAVSC